MILPKLMGPFILGLALITAAASAQTAPASADNGAAFKRLAHDRSDAMRVPSKEERAKFRAALCANIYARQAGRLAYLEAKLSLASNQTGTFESWKSLKLDQAKAMADKCASSVSAPVGTAPTPVDRMTRQEDRLKGRLADLEAEAPVFAAFYNSLSDDQKKAFVRRGYHHMFAMSGGRMRHRAGMFPHRG